VAAAADDSGAYEGGGIIVTHPVGHYVDEEGKEVWICPACGDQYNSLPMIVSTLPYPKLCPLIFIIWFIVL
jgi:hypothetical protein